MNSSSLCSCTYGINKVCTIKQISSQWYKTAQPVFTVKLRNPFSEHYFHILCYIFDSNFIIHTQHYLNDINLDVYSKGKGDSSIAKTNKNKVLVRNMYYIPSLIFPIHQFAVNGQDWGAWVIKNKIKIKAPESINSRFCRGICYISPLWAHGSNKGRWPLFGQVM